MLHALSACVLPFRLNFIFHGVVQYNDECLRVDEGKECGVWPNLKLKTAIGRALEQREAKFG